jgi:predicted TIM-barrel fold metal-dependent hydrolase
MTTPDAPSDVPGVLFFAYAIYAAVDWLFSLMPVRYPDLKICLSEGGIGWVSALLDRLDHMGAYSAMYGTWKGDLTPAEVLQRNFWYCAVEDPSAFVQRERIGVDHILVESDYPHCDSTWPNTQRVIDHEIGGLPAEDIAKMTWKNAAALYRHPVPVAVQEDYEAY